MFDEDNKKINTPIKDLVESTQKDSTVGPMVGSVIVILLMIIGGLYFLGTVINIRKEEIKTEQIVEEQDKTRQVEDTVKQSKSDAVLDIESDIKSTNIDDLDRDLNQIQ